MRALDCCFYLSSEHEHEHPSRSHHIIPYHTLFPVSDFPQHAQRPEAHSNVRDCQSEYPSSCGTVGPLADEQRHTNNLLRLESTSMRKIHACICFSFHILPVPSSSNFLFFFSPVFRISVFHSGSWPPPSSSLRSKSPRSIPENSGQHMRSGSLYRISFYHLFIDFSHKMLGLNLRRSLAKPRPWS